MEDRPHPALGEMLERGEAAARTLDIVQCLWWGWNWLVVETVELMSSDSRGMLRTLSIIH